MDLGIKAIETKKTTLPQRALMKRGVIPKHPTFTYIVGRTGSGKSNLIINLLTRKEFYGPKKEGGRGYFNQVHVWSPTCKTDDLYAHLQLDEANLHDNLDPAELLAFFDERKQQVERKGIERTERILVILDDCVGDMKFMRSKAVRQTLFTNRHANISVWLCSQQFKSVPKAIRDQMRALIYFAGALEEDVAVAEQISAPGKSAKEMLDLVHFATEEPYSFLFCNLTLPFKERYRKNFDEIIQLD